MKDEARALRWAAAVWRASTPNEAEIRVGADRVARRLSGSRPAWIAGKTWAMSVATAALLGVIGYAGRDAWREPARSFSGGDHALDKVRDERPASEQDLPAVSGTAGAQVPPHREGVGAGEPRPLGATPQIAEDVTKGPAPHPSAEPTWIDVSEALAVSDHVRAEKLLFELAARGHDANTRAKAHLGLAQLYESRKNCDAAKQHALRAAAIPDVEIKTVRRALELAARCAR